MTFTSLNDYAVAKSCVNNYTNPICIENNLALSFCSDNGFYSLRVKQDQVAKEIMRGLFDVATEGRNELYAIIVSCIGVVLISSIALVILLIMVIKDKSHVMAIFAEIKREEIHKVISHARSLPITNARFKLQHVEECKGEENKYWKILLRAYRTDASSENKKPKEQKASSPDAAAKKPGEKSESDDAAAGSPKAANPNPEVENAAGILLLQQQSEEDKKQVKKALLSQIEFAFFVFPAPC